MNYTLMHKYIPVVELMLDEDTSNIIKIGQIFNKEHLPVGVQVKHDIVNSLDLKNWWNDRSIPASRIGINNALEILKIEDTKMLLTKCFGLSLSDQYWIKPINKDDITWEKINFFENSFSEDIGDILIGKKINSKNISFHSPDNTSDGFLKKRWKIINNKRCLIKGGSNPYIQQPFNEVIATLIAELLNIEHVKYEIIWDDDKPYSVCEDFIDSNTELVSAWRVMQMKKKDNNTSVYRHFINCCQSLGIKDATLKVNQMIVLDYIIANEDRHQNNFGLIRNAETLEWISIAPIYDSGSSLGYDKLTSQLLNIKDYECKPFKNTHDKQIELVTSFDWIDFDALDNVESKVKNMFNQVKDYNKTIDEERINTIIQLIKNRINKLKEIASSHHEKIDKIEDDVLNDVSQSYLDNNDEIL